MSRAVSAVVRAEAAVNARPGTWLAAGIAALWLPVIARWSPAWSALPEQRFGWAVPALAFMLAWERAAEATHPRSLQSRPRGIAASALLVAALLALPLALTVLAANPLWPLAQWTSVGLAMLATLAALTLAGGADHGRTLAFPVLFVATALTWPTSVTVRLVAALVGFNAQLAATIVAGFGHPAVVHGNVIELANGFVGVDEACSGLRSLQTVWMAGWFFGELFRLRWVGRLVLVGAAMLAAVALNAVRTTALTWIAAAQGLEASERWHDRAGAVELIATLAAVALLAWWLGRKAATAKTNEGATSPDLAAWRSRGATAMLASGALVAAAGPEAWYRWHERGAATRIEWTLVAPSPAWRPVQVPQRAADLLEASSIAGLVDREAGGDQAVAYLVTWTDDVARAANAEAHDPTICLPAAGLKPTVEARPERVDLGGTPVDFTVARFRDGGAEQWVFYCHWDAWLGRARDAQPGEMADVPAWRLMRVREGRRRGDVAYLALVTGAAGSAEARSWLRAWAPRLFRRR